jgi:membrane protein
MKNHAKDFYKSSIDALSDMIKHDGVEHAGYLSFLSLLSLFPFLVFFVAILGMVGETEIGTKFVTLFLDSLPEHVGKALLPRIEEIISGPPQGLLTLAILGAIWTASSAVEGLRTILNRAYRVPTPPAYIWRRLLSIGQFLIMTFIVIAGLLILVVAPVIMNKVIEITHLDFKYLPSSWSNISYIFSTTLLFLSASFLYYVIPNVRQKCYNVFPGAFFTVLLWLGTSELFSVYLSRFKQVNVIYGSLGGVIISLLFFYIIAMIFIYGAEFNYHIEKRRGHRLVAREKVSREDK